MTEPALSHHEGPAIGQLLPEGSRPAAEDKDFQTIPTTLGDLIAALQEASPDDRLVLAVLNDLMDHGRLKKRTEH
jgi:hypothetical protein